jgi:hypothetical protein
MQTIKHQGDVDNSILRDPILDELMLIPADACQISPLTLLIPAQRRKKTGVLRLTLENR